MAGVVVIDWQSVAISVAKFAKQQELRSFGNMMLGGRGGDASSSSNRLSFALHACMLLLQLERLMVKVLVMLTSFKAFGLVVRLMLVFLAR